MFQRNREYACIGLAVLVCLALRTLPADRQESLAHGLRSFGWSTGQWVFARVIRFARGQEASQYLLTQNVQLALENMRLQEAEEENRRLRLALRFRERQQIDEVIPAEVIGRDPDQMLDVIVINAGRDLGLRKDWPVVTTAGLVGHIKEVDDNSSVVQLIFGSRVSALVQGSRAQGVVSAVGGNRFQLRYADASTQIQKGDRVVSSGVGGRYPKGITIGYITEVNTQEQDPLFKEVLLESGVDFWGLEEVFVLTQGAR